jgi:large subunit ribosomal protein L21
MLVDGDDIAVGTPTVDGVQVKTTVVSHVKGPKLVVFKYSPRKRIRVKSGHRQQYTQLMVNAIGSLSKVAKEKAKAEPKVEKAVVKKDATAKKAPAKKTEKAPAKKAPAKKATEKKPAAKKTTTKKSTAKKTTTKKSSSTKKTEK